MTIFVKNRLYQVLIAIIFFFVVGEFIGLFYWLALALVIFLGGLLVIDIYKIYKPGILFGMKRELPKVLSNGDINNIRLKITNNSPSAFFVEVIDEVPVQFQLRNFEKNIKIKKGETHVITYSLTPKTRGQYFFGKTHLFITSDIGLVSRKITLDNAVEIPTYPSIIQMHKFDLKFVDSTSQDGQKKWRRMGRSYEFDQIKNYVPGDDRRTINWKASSKRATLMVNQYEEEKSLQVYNIIDKSRVMEMPFEGLSLLDYAINSSLVISNISLQKGDKPGLLTFSDKIGAVIKADNSPRQLNLILTALYKEESAYREADYQLLYMIARKLITGRSLVILYTNFTILDSLERILPYLRKLNFFHKLIVVVFKNKTIEELSESDANSVHELYRNTLAKKEIKDTEEFLVKLKLLGIQYVYTTPQNLSFSTSKKYLQLKSQGLI